MTNQEVIKKWLNFDEEDASTGFVSNTKPGVLSLEMLWDRINEPVYNFGNEYRIPLKNESTEDYELYIADGCDWNKTVHDYGSISINTDLMSRCIPEQASAEDFILKIKEIRQLILHGSAYNIEKVSSVILLADTPNYLIIKPTDHIPSNLFPQYKDRGVVSGGTDYGVIFDISSIKNKNISLFLNQTIPLRKRAKYTGGDVSLFLCFYDDSEIDERDIDLTFLSNESDMILSRVLDIKTNRELNGNIFFNHEMSSSTFLKKAETWNFNIKNIGDMCNRIILDIKPPQKIGNIISDNDNIRFKWR